MRIDAMMSFIALVETGSYAAAAATLYTSSSTIHSQVKAIEAELRADLVTFGGRVLRLTDAGSRFLVFARRTVAEFQRLQGDMTTRPVNRPETLRVVAPAGIASNLLPRVTRAMVKRRPGLRVLLDGRRANEAATAIVGRQADVAVLIGPEAEFAAGLFETTVVGTSRGVFAVRRREGLRGRDGAMLLREWPLSVPAAGTQLRLALDAWMARTGDDTEIRYEHTMVEGALNDAWSEPCIALVPDYVLRFARNGSDFLAFEVPGFECDQEIVAVLSPIASDVAREFVAALEATLAGADLEEWAADPLDNRPWGEQSLVTSLS